MGRDGESQPQVSVKRKLNIFARGLDRWNHLETTCEIRFFAQGIFAVFEASGDTVGRQD